MLCVALSSALAAIQSGASRSLMYNFSNAFRSFSRCCTSRQSLSAAHGYVSSFVRWQGGESKTTSTSGACVSSSADSIIPHAAAVTPQPRLSRSSPKRCTHTPFSAASLLFLYHIWTQPPVVAYHETCERTAQVGVCSTWATEASAAKSARISTGSIGASQSTSPVTHLWAACRLGYLPASAACRQGRVFTATWKFKRPLRILYVP